jgi:hypothetical protein
MVLDDFDAYGRRTQWTSTPGSAVEVDRTRLSRQYGAGICWDDTAANYASASAVLFTAVAGQHLETIRVLLESREVIFAPAPPARTVLEFSGHVHWLLDPSCTNVRDRAARAWLAELQDQTRRKTAAHALSHPDASKFGGIVHQLRKKTIPDHFYPSELAQDARGALLLRRQKHPGLEEALTYINKAQSRPWNTAGAYAYLSNVSHPTRHVIIENIELDAMGRGRSFTLEDVTLPYRITRLALLAFLRSWQITAAYLGLDQNEPNRLALKVDALPEP